MFLFSCAYAYAYVACVMLIAQVWTRLKGAGSLVSVEAGNIPIVNTDLAVSLWPYQILTEMWLPICFGVRLESFCLQVFLELSGKHPSNFAMKLYSLFLVILASLSDLKLRIITRDEKRRIYVSTIITFLNSKILKLSFHFTRSIVMISEDSKKIEGNCSLSIPNNTMTASWIWVL